MTIAGYIAAALVSLLLLSIVVIGIAKILRKEKIEGLNGPEIPPGS